MKILLVDDEVQVLRGVSRMLESEMDDWEVETANSGPEALNMLDSEKFNVVVSDMRMPGMDGAQLLSEIADQFPEILRIVLSGQADRDTVMRAIQPMHQYLAKPCDPQLLIDVISRAEVFQATIMSVDVLHAIGNANCLPSVPDIVSDLNQELESNTCKTSSIAAIVSRDPVVSARVLQLANSAIFGMRHPVVELDQAIGVIGSEMVRSLVLTQALMSEGKHSSVLSTEALFDHCFRTAVVTRELAEIASLDFRRLNTIFTSGLLHDIGKVLLVNAFPERYAKVLEKAKETNRPVSELEVVEFGASHEGVGAYLLEMWGIPSEIIEIVGAHHNFEICAKRDMNFQVVYAANWIANGADENRIIEAALDASDAPEVEAFKEQLLQWKQLYTERATEGEDG